MRAMLERAAYTVSIWMIFSILFVHINLFGTLSVWGARGLSVCVYVLAFGFAGKLREQ